MATKKTTAKKSQLKVVKGKLAIAVLTRGQKAAATRKANQLKKFGAPLKVFGVETPREATAEEIAAESTAPKVEEHAPLNTAAAEVKQLEDRDELARGLLGPNAVVWTATHNSKGLEFPAPRFRVGVPTDKPEGYLVEGGRQIIGVGVTFAEAFRDAKKRTEAAAAKA
jgi:hypothetical protein